MKEDEMFRIAKGFNEDYFKKGQLIKVTVKNFQGAFLEIDYGFIKHISFNKIVFIYIDSDCEPKEKTITPADLCQNELEINIETISNIAIKNGW